MWPLVAYAVVEAVQWAEGRSAAEFYFSSRVVPGVGVLAASRMLQDARQAPITPFNRGWNDKIQDLINQFK